MKKLIAGGFIYVFLIVVIIPSVCVFISYKKDLKKEPFETVEVYIKDEDRVEIMNTSQYLKEVVGAEMPAVFSFEALKAQAVAARTYLLLKKEKGEDAPEHKGAVVCTDYTHCKAWMSETDRKAAWEKEKSDEYWKKISDAVEKTTGEIIVYDGKPISALFHSTSSGRTENACDVWGEDVPYLKSVESRGDELSPKFLSEKRYSQEEFKNIIMQNVDKADINSMLYENIIRSEAGGIIKITLLGVEVKGTIFRNIFGLQSTNAEILQDKNEIVIKVKGNGHGVGMSQYGAEFMAANGSNYQEILKYYYTGTDIQKAP